MMSQLAYRTERLHGIPAELVFAQLAIESNWLDPDKCRGNNALGIKYSPRHHNKQFWWTRERFDSETARRAWIHRQAVEPLIINVQPGEPAPADNGLGRRTFHLWTQGGYFWCACYCAFAAFPTLEDCCDDHARIVLGQFSPGYLPAWDRYRESKDRERLFQDLCAVYATSSYGTLAWKIAQQANVRNALAAVRREGVELA